MTAAVAGAATVAWQHRYLRLQCMSLHSQACYLSFSNWNIC